MISWVIDKIWENTPFSENSGLSRVFVSCHKEYDILRGLLRKIHKYFPVLKLLKNGDWRKYRAVIASTDRPFSRRYCCRQYGVHSGRLLRYGQSYREEHLARKSRKSGAGVLPPLPLPASASAKPCVNNISQTVLVFSNFFCLL